MTTLDTPLTLPCGLTLPNRTALAPLTNTQSHPDGTLGDDELHWLLARARGGWGLVSTCAAWVSEEGHAWRGQLGIARDEHVPGLHRLADSLKGAGARAVVQLHHGGLKAEVSEDRISADAGDGVCAATEADLEQVKNDFVAAALRAQQAGFAGVEVHGANGYLFTQFLAPEDNHRTDRWGGDLESRARLLRETLRAVRAAVRSDFAVGVRISPVDGWQRRGLVLEDGVQTAAWLAEDGADWIHLSLGDASGPPPHEDGPPVVRAVRDAVRDDVPVFAAGGVWTREDAERALEAGADVVVVGRAAIIHPDWPRVSAQDGWTPQRPPWTEDALRKAAVGTALIDYLGRFAGLVEGGEEAR